ncbi:tetratricopeptide repeat-containing protein [Rhizobium sp. BK376]|uniref:ATP-grasp domain-containing protein n=1 Tax=Rhizobium sp. BK376 TaxID=2512149 RepID=UPI0010E2FD8F|nr:tetratricopeptide repeat-containing protein [Rhizobium sp. BK376]TCR85256.1 glutathione synthase/RimK-type ligase-like ATP-grasp enzyme [Rhizobium sp. BK376]
MNSGIASGADDEDALIGKATIVRTLYEGRDIRPLWDQLLERVSANGTDASAFHDLATILYALGRPEDASASENAALGISRTFRINNGHGTGISVLALVTAGDFMSNTPLEFLLERSNTTILLHYVDSRTKRLDDVPPHDVAFVAIAESEANMPVLENLERLLVDWKTPIMNNAPRRIIDLARDKVAELLSTEPSILAPITICVERGALIDLASSAADTGGLRMMAGFPFVVRPVGTHAGGGMAKIATASELEVYLNDRPEDTFFVAPFVDYSGTDGKFRKQRITFIDGRAFASHLAVSDHWMVHYLSAGMADHADRRAEEASWMASFDVDFARRHANAFDALYRRLGLDYFAIDCAELPDGRLLLFEADVAMIIHSMDPVTIFPYKQRPMQLLFEAFVDALYKRIEQTDPS